MFWHDNTAELPNLEFIKAYISLSSILPNNIDQSKVELMFVQLTQNIHIRLASM